MYIPIHRTYGVAALDTSREVGSEKANGDDLDSPIINPIYYSCFHFNFPLSQYNPNILFCAIIATVGSGFRAE